MREIFLKIKNDQLADNIIAIIKKMKGIEILDKSKKKQKKKSKIFQIIDKPYNVKDFKIYKRSEIYDRSGIH